MSKDILLIPSSHSIPVIPDIAKSIGLNEAIILQQVHYWLEKNKENKRNFKDGYYWTYNSYKNWCEQFPWWCERTIKTIFLKLEKQGYLITGNYNSMKIDKTKWYRINYDKIHELENTSRECKSCTIKDADFAQAIPETNTETNNAYNGNNGSELSLEARCVSVPSVNLPDKNIVDFMEWYYIAYKNVKGIAHPLLKADQKVRVHDTLKAFLDENSLDVEMLQDMAESFFCKVDYSDHNINHFATAGILEIRFYDSVY